MAADDPPDHEQMDQDLKGIGEHLRRLHSELGERKPLANEDEGEHAIDMNPLTPDDDDRAS